MADGPLTNPANLLCTVDTGNSLVCVLGTKSGSDGPARNAFAIRLRTNNGALVVVPASGWNI